MNYEALKNYIRSDEIEDIIGQILCTKSRDEILEEKERYLRLLDEAYALYGDGDYHFISSPGRTEIGGNHTDHQHGHVVAASLNMDNLVVVKGNDDKIVRYRDGDFRIRPVDLNDLSIKEEEINTSESLIRGIAFRLNELGYRYGGFDALCESRVLVGSGISSSACFEVMLVEIFNALYNEDVISPVERAKIGQFAENVYFGKPSGLLDQMAISVGGFVTINFQKPENPDIENFAFSFDDYGYDLILVNTKGDHSDLSYEYAAIPNEIKMVAKQLGVEYLADCSQAKFMDHYQEIREKIGNDRAMLRAMHFYNEDKRAVAQREAIREGDIDSLLRLMKKSGNSSYEYLQNVYSNSRVNSQSLSIGLALADQYLDGDGAYRVHGGGFEGTIQLVVPHEKTEGISKLMCSVFGDDCLMKVKIRPFGTKTVI